MTYIVKVKTDHWNIPVPLTYEIYGPTVTAIKSAIQQRIDDAYHDMHYFELLSVSHVPDDTDMTDFPSIRRWEFLR